MMDEEGGCAQNGGKKGSMWVTKAKKFIWLKGNNFILMCIFVLQNRHLQVYRVGGKDMAQL